MKQKMEPLHIQDTNKLCQVAEPLLTWYYIQARILPWREEPTPYRVWISEIMLQQTRVEAVLPYFRRFLDALPDVASLVAAPEGVVLKLWEGLGYYSRARNLKKAAKSMVDSYGGQLPGAYEELLKLPGIGQYTAGAIASIAFGIAVPAVDGNVLRVMARLLAFDGDIGIPANIKVLRQDVAAMIPPGRPGDFNQAMMELGATVCLPDNPRCFTCPVRQCCQAFEKDQMERFPVKAPKKPRRLIDRTVVVILAGDKALLRKRPDKGLLAGMWELPGFEQWLEPHEVEDKLKGWGLPIISLERLEDGVHVFTHVEWHMRGYRAFCQETLLPEGWAWVDAKELREGYPLPSAFKAYKGYLPG